MFRHHQVGTGGKAAEKPSQREKGEFGAGPLAVRSPVPVQYIAAVIPENDGAVAVKAKEGRGIGKA